MNIRLELKDFNALRHRVASCIRALEGIPAVTSMPKAAQEGLQAMLEDGRRIKEVFDAASGERELPMPFVAVVDTWVERAEAATVSVDLSEETSR